MPQYDFPSNVSANYNRIKEVVDGFDQLIKKVDQSSNARVIVIVDDPTAIKNLYVSVEVFHKASSFTVERTFTSGTNMTNTNVNTNMNTFITANLVPGLPALFQYVNG